METMTFSTDARNGLKNLGFGDYNIDFLLTKSPIFVR